MFEILFTLLLFQAPKQPVPFSHKVHAGALKLKCKMCHPNSGSGETMQIVKSATCNQCHPEFKGEFRWVRVYEIPSYVSFSHKTHLDAGSACEDCHGRVAERDQLTKEGDISMGGCMNCHRLKKVSIDCTFCHEQP